MKTVTIDKDRLKAKVGTNRDRHQARYLQAKEGWKSEVLAALALGPQQFEESGSLDKLNFQYRFPEPTSHTEEYDTALEMIDWETSDLIELDEHAFRRLVLDNWDWTHSFLASSSRYTAT